MSPNPMLSRRRKRQASVKSFFAPVEHQPARCNSVVQSTERRVESLVTEKEHLDSPLVLLKDSVPCSPSSPQASFSRTPSHISLPPSIPSPPADLEAEVDADAPDAASSPSSPSFIPSPPSEPETVVATVSRQIAPCTLFSVDRCPSLSIAPTSASSHFTFNTPFPAINLPKRSVASASADFSFDSTGSKPVDNVGPQSSPAVFNVEAQLEPTAAEKALKQPSLTDKSPCTSVGVAVSSSSIDGNGITDEDVAENTKPTRKRRRSKAWPVRRERPCTRASLRQVCSPLPPPAVENIFDNECFAKDSIIVPGSCTPPSRLNRARNIARRAAILGQGPLNIQSASNNVSPAVVAIDDDIDEADFGGSNDDEKEDVCTEYLQSESPVTTLAVVPASSTVASTAAASPVSSTPPLSDTSKKRSLHPFFAATAAAVTSSRDKSKAPRVDRPVCDAWSCPAATIHVNSLPSQSAMLPRGGFESYPLRRGSSLCERQRTEHDVPLSSVKFSYYPSENGMTFSSSFGSERSEIIAHVSSHPDAWADRYRTDHRIDVINAAVTDELTEWLRTWYGNRRSLIDGEDERLLLQELDDSISEERERVAVITGPIGCGKTTVVAAAARSLGLSVLEINAGVCRTGRRVREIIGEALRTHRVVHGKIATGGSGCILRQPLNGQTSSFNGKAKTLILFEEVDELQADEKGFWTSVQELASSDECRRPIICTANSFTTAMRQVFAKQKIGAQCDFDRLVVGTKEEGVLNETPFRHISFPEVRSERQALSVLQRVAQSEKVGLNGSLPDHLTALNLSDIRRSINELQFWTSRGQVNPTKNHHGEILEKGTMSFPMSKLQDDRIASPADCEIARMLFIEGSSNFCLDRQPIAEMQAQHDNSHTLETWASALESMSVSDTIFHRRNCEMIKRSVDSRLAPDSINLDDDLLKLSHVADDISIESLSFSRCHLTQPLERSRDQEMLSNTHQQFSQFVSCVPPVVPRARRPVLTDYLPILISMVRAEGIRKNSGADSVIEQQRHRTRSRTKRSGLSALNLDNATITLLKKVSIAPQSTQTNMES